jgi:hypothetical protein
MGSLIGGTWIIDFPRKNTRRSRCGERLLPAEAEVIEESPAPDAEGVMGLIVDLRRY